MINNGTLLALCILTTTSLPGFAVPPAKSIGQGLPDFTEVTGRPATPRTWYLSGYASFTSYQGGGLTVPPNMRYLSLYMYGKGFETSRYCSATGPDGLCNIPIVPGTSLAAALSLIPSTFNFEDGYFIYASNLSGICGGIVLSATKDASRAEYSVGDFICGVRPPATKCDINPSDLSLSLQMGPNSTVQGTTTGEIQCNTTAQIRVRTPYITDSRLPLGGSGAPTAVLSINGRAATEGVELNVTGSSNIIIRADITSGSGAGEFIGSTPLVIEYR